MQERGWGHRRRPMWRQRHRSTAGRFGPTAEAVIRPAGAAQPPDAGGQGGGGAPCGHVRGGFSLGEGRRWGGGVVPPSGWGSGDPRRPASSSSSLSWRPLGEEKRWDERGCGTHRTPIRRDGGMG